MPSFQLGGLVSGLDLDGLVNRMKGVWRKPAALLEQRKSKLNTEANAWRDVNKRLLTLKTRLDGLNDATLFDGKTASVGDAGVVTATAAATAVPGSYIVEVTQLARTRSYQSTITSVADPAAATGYTGTVDVLNADGSVRGSFVIDNDTGTSLNDIARVMNDDTETLQVRAAVVATNPGEYHLVVTGSETGWDNRFRFQDAAGTLMQDLGVLDAGGGDVAGAMVVDARNTELTVNGLAIARNGVSFGDVIPGVTLNVLKAGATTTVSVTENTGKPVSAVKAFVDQYNSVVSFIQEKMKYNPETKAAGELIGDLGLVHLGGDLRRRLTADVSGLPSDMNSVFDIGIKTTATGALSLDEAKLTAALKADPDGVKAVFQQAEDGLVAGLGGWLQRQTTEGGMLLGRAAALDKSIKVYTQRVKYVDEVLLPKEEARLRRQFDNLERAMSTFQNQGQWLSAQISSLNRS